MKVKAAESELFNAGLAIVKKIRQHGEDAYFVGGFVRNLLLGIKCKDIDIVSTMLPSELLKIFPEAQTAGASFGVIIVKSGEYHFEVATAREERLYMDGRHPEKVLYTKDLQIDSERRDFTVNAMFYDPESMEILDFHNGINDLQKGILRTVGDSTRRFQEDYLRMLRAIRFSAAYGFEIAPGTRQAICENAALCSRIAPERIRQELDLMFGNRNAFKAFELLDASGILQIILPEVHILHEVEQPANFHPEGDVFKHTLLMLKRMAYPSADLAWSIILHDIGKKPCFFRDARGIHFFGHEAKGADMAEEILSRLTFSNSRKKLISTLVRDHMRFVQVKNMRLATLRKLLAREDLPLLLELNRLDSGCSCNLMGDWLFMLDSLAKYHNQEILPTPAIGGRDLLKMGIKPGPDFKKILDFLYEKQLSGKKIDFHTAYDLIKKHFPCIL